LRTKLLFCIIVIYMRYRLQVWCCYLENWTHFP